MLTSVPVHIADSVCIFQLNHARKILVLYENAVVLVNLSYLFYFIDFKCFK